LGLVSCFEVLTHPAGGETLRARNWQQAGWSDVTAQNAVTKANRAVEKIAAALPALTGDATSTLSGFLGGNEVGPDERRNDQRRNDARNDDKRRNDARSKAEIAEEALLEAMRTARAVNDAIYELAVAVPKADAPVSEEAPLPVLLRQPDGIAKLMMASNAGISVTIVGIRQLPAMRAGEAAEVPGTQTLYPPDEDQPPWAALEAFREKLKQVRQVSAVRAKGTVAPPGTQTVYRPGESLQAAEPGADPEDYPLRSSMEAFDEELRAIMAGEYDKA